MRLYKIIRFQDDYIIVPTIQFKCPFCNHDMLFHDYLVQIAAQGFYHADIHLKCSYCGFYATFGIPISSGEYQKLKNSKWHRRIVDKDIIYLYPDLELEKRLESWGYW